jgi:hypothetical protein
MEKLEVLLDMFFSLSIPDPVLRDGQSSVPWGRLLSSRVYAESASCYDTDEYLDVL